MSDENKNPFIESFLKLHELAGGTAQDRIPMQQRIRNASGSGMGGFGNVPDSTNIARANQSASSLGGFGNVPNSTNTVRANQSSSALGGFGNTTDSTNIVRANQSSSAQTYKPDLSTRQNAEMGSRALGGFSKVPDSLQAQREKSASALNFPGKGTTGLGATSPEGYIERSKGVEKANPIAAPGKLQGGNLQLGSRGDSVKELQRKLGIKDDGIFGKDTAAALKKMQQSAGLKADAVYGKQSASYLQRKDALANLRKDNPIGAEKVNTGTSNETEYDRTNSSNWSDVNAHRINTGNEGALGGRAGRTSDAADDREYANSERDAKRAAQYKLQNRNRDRMESTEMPNKLIDSFLKLQSLKTDNIFEAAKKVNKLDPVGKEDEDLNNNGKKNDKSDKYLKNRRKKIADAMNEGIKVELRPQAASGIKQWNDTPKKLQPETQVQGGQGIQAYDSATKAAPKAAPTRPQGDNPQVKPAIPNSKPSGYVVGSGVDRAEMEMQSPHKRGDAEYRKKLKEATDPNGELDAPSSGGKAPATSTNPDWLKKMKPQEQTPNRAAKSSLPKGVTVKGNTNEEVTFSEAELEHIASVLEAIAPQGEDNTAFGKSGSRTGTLTDETLPKKKIKEEVEELDEEEAKKVPGKRGRKAGVPVGAYGPRKSKEERAAAKASGKKDTPVVSGNPTVPHPFHQIRSQRPDAEGNYTVQHDTGNGVISAKVPAGHAAKFHNDYLKTEKPKDKEEMTKGFVQKTFKLEAPKAATGITLPKMPKPKS